MPVLSSGRELLFAPEDPIRSRVLNLVEDARRSVDLQAYILTLEPLVSSLCDLARNGRTVRVLASADPEHRKSFMQRIQIQQLGKLKEAGAQVALGLSSYGGILHGKYGIVDDSVVFHGSYNFTSAAETQGNHLCVEHEADAVRAFIAQFQREWERVYRVPS